MSGVDPTGSGAGRSGFRPDIEGLRAVAIGLVVLFHAEVPRITGGYVGVDVFFVISGFLITGLLLREIGSTGTVSLTGFYARRIRRLVPAAAILVVVTVVASGLVLAPLRAADVAGDGVAAALYVSNIRFAVQATDYLQSQLPPSPLLHLWSLGVEEQFYLFWPALLILVTRGLRRGRRDLLVRVGVVSGLVIVGSFALSLWLTSTNEPWAFFSLPTRAWELALGAILAVTATRLARLPRRLTVSAAWIGLAMIVASAFVLGPATPYPGMAALLPTVGVALALLPGMGAGTSSLPVRLLGTAPMRFFGRISYSLYLWHWPLIVLPLAMAGGELPLAARLGLMILAVPIAYVSRRWVEDPVMHGRWLGRLPRRSLVFAAGTSVLVIVVSLGVRSTVLAPLGTDVVSAAERAPGAAGLADPFGTLAPRSPSPSADRSAPPSAPPSVAPSAVPAAVGGPVPHDLLPSLASARDDLPITYRDGCHLDQIATTIPPCVFGDPGSPTTVILFGDSHAAQWFPALDAIAKERGWRLVSITKSGCTPDSTTIWLADVGRPDAGCDQWREAAFNRIQAEHPALVVLASSRGYQVAGDGGPAPDDAAGLRQGLATTIARLKSSTPQVALMADTPRFPFDPPECLSQHLQDALACSEPRSKVIDTAWNRMEGQVAADAGIDFVETAGWACSTEPCSTVVGRFLVYRDSHHLATPFVTAIRARIAAALPDLPG